MREIFIQSNDWPNHRPAVQISMDTRENNKICYNADFELAVIKKADESVLIEQIREREIKNNDVNDLYSVLGYQTYNDVNVWDALENLTPARKEVVVDIITNLYKQQLLEARHDNN